MFKIMFHVIIICCTLRDADGDLKDAQLVMPPPPVISPTPVRKLTTSRYRQSVGEIAVGKLASHQHRTNVRNMLGAIAVNRSAFGRNFMSGRHYFSDLIAIFQCWRRAGIAPMSEVVIFKSGNGSTCDVGPTLCRLNFDISKLPMCRHYGNIVYNYWQ